MPRHPTPLLGLLLCLGQVIHTQRGALPRPTIWAEPASVVPWGQPVTIGCGGPAEAEIFHLEKEGRPSYQGMRNHLHGTEARFPIGAAGEDTAGLYHCAYYQGFTWSESSDTLELMVTAPPSPNYRVGNCVRLSLAGVVLLILVLILAEAWYSQSRSQQRLQGRKQEVTQQRLDPQVPGGTSPDL
ncbi:leukocyte-associated immunoglobulin-like receptor 2 isoform X2 [Suricata suricatta]|uniref:leukocyte-associated immunoglobulin-like receptor 2 isoform X2 n=1 Tax=Suricata suricatta TaxID=37032 RepID=UPI001155A9B0|nr:leukocyte-associated immunoglobulin-like receptor 2 isoform X2 [Suricata suricatta]